jgi:hypothetical protein
VVIARQRRRCSVQSAHAAQLQQLCSRQYLRMQTATYVCSVTVSKAKRRLHLCLRRCNLSIMRKPANLAVLINTSNCSLPHLQPRQLLVLSMLASVILPMHYDAFVRMLLYTTAVPSNSNHCSLSKATRLDGHLRQTISYYTAVLYVR